MKTVASLILVAMFGHAVCADEVSFNRDVRPILSDKCFKCHGPDERAREAELRLDIESKARTVITANKPDKSELIARITHADPEQRMPPADSGKSLSPGEVKTLRRWIAEGAKWQRHWSFLTLERPSVPMVADKTWVRNPIDAFVLARLERSKPQRKPSPRADKVTLIRRVTLDLTGLPPTVEEINRFLEDKSPRAYERVVDRLLQSSEYGERMAMKWLDIARYADSHGYSLDRRRVMWPWRDWVIQAYNQNMPFDQFTIEQLAGDLLPNPTTSQRIATGFNRNHPIQSEGGVINEEYRVETVVDRVETTSAAFLGLTMGCCRCHDHKYDPISQREFYQLFAFFNNVPETAHVGNRDRQADRPTLKAPSVLFAEQEKRLTQEIAAFKKRVARENTERPTKVTERVWIDDQLPKGAQPFGNGGGAQKFEFVSGPDHPVLQGKRSSFRASQGRGQHGFQGANPGLVIGSDTRLFAYVFLNPKNPPKEIMLQWNAGSWEHRAYWGQNLIPWGKDKTSSRKHIGPLPKTGQWVRLEVNAADVGLKPGSQVNGWAFTQFDGTLHWDKAGAMQAQPTPAELRLSELQSALAQLVAAQPTTMVMAEMTPRRKTFVLDRGQYDRPTKVQVAPGVPSALGKLPDSKTSNRLTLARWLVAKENPLTARVAVNRYWQMYFGHGLVRTPDDFGAQGALPTHPDLLDWLATEFMRLKWNVKAMQKLILMSATYQQSSRITQRSRGDAANRLLGRGPRLRLPAEMIRDQALAVSGLLVKQLGGPSVSPYQPQGLWDDVVYSNVPRFVQDHGDKLYRRSMYTYWKRSVPPPNLQILDAPSREACVLQRSRTNTPQAALVLMNDPTFVEAARKLAERVLATPADSQTKRLEIMFRMVTARRPSSYELQRLNKTLSALLADFDRDKKAAADLLRVGESPKDEKLNTVQAAAYTAIANVLLGLDEVITKH